MSTKDAAGLESAVTADRIDSADEIGELIDGMESVDWRAVPTFSTAETAALTARLIEAREALQEHGLDE